MSGHAIGDFGSYWGGIRDNGVLGIGRENSDGSNTIFNTTATALDPVNSDVLLRFDVFGNTISLFAWQEGSPMPASPQLLVLDNVWTDGGALGLTLNPNLDGGSSSAAVAFRSYTVLPEAMQAGDFNADGSVNDVDLAAWETGFGEYFTGEDLLVWQANFGSTGGNVALAVPEPTTSMLLLGLLACGRLRCGARRENKWRCEIRKEGA